MDGITTRGTIRRRQYTGPFQKGERHNRLKGEQVLPMRDGRTFCSWRCDCGKLRFAHLHKVRQGNTTQCDDCANKARAKRGIEALSRPESVAKGSIGRRKRFDEMRQAT